MCELTAVEPNRALPRNSASVTAGCAGVRVGGGASGPWGGERSTCARHRLRKSLVGFLLLLFIILEYSVGDV